MNLNLHRVPSLRSAAGRAEPPKLPPSRYASGEGRGCGGFRLALI
jgi:hypothetical protein